MAELVKFRLSLLSKWSQRWVLKAAASLYLLVWKGVNLFRPRLLVNSHPVHNVSVAERGDSHTHQTWACASCSRHTNIKLIIRQRGSFTPFSVQPGYEISLRAQPASADRHFNSLCVVAGHKTQRACIVNKNMHARWLLFLIRLVFSSPRAECANKFD